MLCPSPLFPGLTRDLPQQSAQTREVPAQGGEQDGAGNTGQPFVP